MTAWFLSAAASLPAELAVAFLAAVPVIEVRGSIPLGMAVYEMSAWSSFLWSMLGNAVPALVLPFIFTPARLWLARHFPHSTAWVDRWIEQKRAKFSASYERYGAVALAIFVAIPFPMTGVWTGAVLAAVFLIPRHKAIPSLLLGMLGAGLIVLAITTGVLSGLRFLL